MPKTKQQKLEARREYYVNNIVKERASAKDRAKRRRLSETPEEAEERKARHRIAAARYRNLNKGQLRINSWEYRIKQKLIKEREGDEEEYQRLHKMAMEGCDE